MKSTTVPETPVALEMASMAASIMPLPDTFALDLAAPVAEHDRRARHRQRSAAELEAHDREAVHDARAELLDDDRLEVGFA